VFEGSAFGFPADDVVRDVKRQQQDREQRRDDQDYVVLHSMLCVRFALVESDLAQRRQSVRLPCGPSSRAWRHTCARTSSLRRRADLRGRTAATFAGTVEVVAADRQNVIPTPDVNLRRVVVMPLDMADCSQIYDDRP